MRSPIPARRQSPPGPCWLGETGKAWAQNVRTFGASVVRGVEAVQSRVGQQEAAAVEGGQVDDASAAGEEVGCTELLGLVILLSTVKLVAVALERVFRKRKRAAAFKPKWIVALRNPHSHSSPI